MNTIGETTEFDAPAKDIYEILLNSEKHSELIGADAYIEDWEGGKFSMWEGTIHGTVEKLIPGKLIVLKWRADENGWPKDYYSTATFELLEHEKGKTVLNFVQEGIPSESIESVEDGWNDFYWEAMRRMVSKM